MQCDHFPHNPHGLIGERFEIGRVDAGGGFVGHFSVWWLRKGDGLGGRGREIGEGQGEGDWGRGRWVCGKGGGSEFG